MSVQISSILRINVYTLYYMCWITQKHICTCQQNSWTLEMRNFNLGAVKIDEGEQMLFEKSIDRRKEHKYEKHKVICFAGSLFLVGIYNTWCAYLVAFGILNLHRIPPTPSVMFHYSVVSKLSCISSISNNTNHIKMDY